MLLDRLAKAEQMVPENELCLNSVWDVPLKPKQPGEEYIGLRLPNSTQIPLSESSSLK